MPIVRKNIRLPADNYIGQRAYFLTICCHGRRPLLRDAERVARHVELLTDLANQLAFAVLAYCFMPDHVHFLCEGLTPASRLLDFAQQFKQQTEFEHRRRTATRLWQFKYYDHILRRAESKDTVAWYIWMNPVRKGLCAEPFDFPFSGSMTSPWKQKASPVVGWLPPWKSQKDAGLKPLALHTALHPRFHMWRFDFM
jgi:putative transposase